MPSTDLIQLIKRHEGEVKNIRGRHVLYDDKNGKAVTIGGSLKGLPTVGFGT